MFESRERAPGDVAPNDVTTAAFSTSYAIKKIVPAGQPHEFYVNGRARNGDDIVERWLISILDGSRYASRVSAPAPIGSPGGPHSLASP